jgi:hypothetical protein
MDLSGKLAKQTRRQKPLQQTGKRSRRTGIVANRGGSSYSRGRKLKAERSETNSMSGSRCIEEGGV